MVKALSPQRNLLSNNFHESVLCDPGVVTTSGFFLQKNYHSQVQYYHSQDVIVKPTGSDALLHHYKTQNYIYEKIFKQTTRHYISDSVETSQKNSCLTFIHRRHFE